MDTIISTAQIPMEGLMAMLSSMTLSDRRWVAQQLTEQVEKEEREINARWKDWLADAPSLKEKSDSRLDAALARFHKNWGGDKSPVEIANELRQGADMVTDIETW